jgi:AcrR family transcriptional regulator
MFQTNLSDCQFTEKNVPHRKTYHHGNLKTALIEKAVEIIKEEGVAGLSLRKAARKVGVSHAAPAHHFGDLTGLLGAVSREGFGLLLQKMDSVQNDIFDSNPMSRLKRVCLSYIDFALEHTSYFKVMYNSRLTEKATRHELDKGNRKVYRRLADCVMKCQSSGIVKAGNPMHMGIFVWTTIHGYATLVVDGQMFHDKTQAVEGEIATLIIWMISAGLQKHDNYSAVPAF